MNRIFAFSAITAIATVSQAAVPSVSDVTMSQDDNRTVTITYKLANAPAVVTVDIETNAGNNVWASIGGQHIQRVTGDVWKKVSGKDTYKIKWRPDKDWPDHQVTDGNARAKVTAWALNSTPNYMVVDITAAAQPNTQRYYPSKEFVPGGVLGNADYRTSKLLMRRIPAKDIEWTAGSLDEYGRTVAREKQFLATLSNDFYIGVFEITQQQWLSLTGKSPSFFTTERQMRPVEKVSINEIRHSNLATDHKGGDWPNAPYAGSFLDLLRGRTGLDFDLPFECQWEFACRAGCGDGYWNNGLPYTSSETDPNLPGRFKTKGLVDGKTDPAANCGPEHGTAICGSSEPNAWGLYDMHGNVAEWCQDWFSNDISPLKGLPNIWLDDPTKPALDNHAAINYKPCRGGKWNTKSAECRSAFRDARNPNTQDSTYGFRVTCTAGLD